MGKPLKRFTKSIRVPYPKLKLGVNVRSRLSQPPTLRGKISDSDVYVNHLISFN
jgi:hypothetical protein